MTELKSLTIILNKSCNLQCEYCFINKDEDIASISSDITKNLQDAIVNNYYKSKLKEIFNPKELNSVTELHIWGGEPTLHSESILLLVSQLLEICPNLRNIIFSSNWSLPNYDKKMLSIYEGLKHIHENEFPYTNPFKLQVQCSVDGPEKFNNRRGKGLSDKILININHTLNKLIPVFNSRHCAFYFHTHSVVDMNSFKLFTNIDDVSDYFSYFYAIERLNPNLKDNGFKFLSMPNMVLKFPMKSTSEDGKIVEKAYRTFYNYHVNGMKNNLPEFYQKEIRYIIPGSDRFRISKSNSLTIKDLENILYEMDTRNITSQPLTSSLCGQGVYGITMGINGKFALCQNSFFDLFPKYLDYINKESKNKDFIKNKANYKEMSKDWTFNNYDEYLKFANIVNEYYEYVMGGREYYGDEILTNGMIEAYARAGLIDPKYNEEREREFAAKYIDKANNCMAINMEIGGSIFCPPLFQIPLYLNGAFDWIEKMRRKQIENRIREIKHEAKFI